MDNLIFTSAHQLAHLIREHHISAIEILDAHLTDITHHNPTLQAICTLDAENARARAQDADAALAQGKIWEPLHGVPITIKDIFEIAGLRTTAGDIPLKAYIPQ